MDRLYVVENPSIIALAVGEFGVRTPPMACSTGWPTAAVTELAGADYLGHAADHGSPAGRVSEAPWDAALASAMREHGIAVLEETVWELLRDDLREDLQRHPGA